MMPEKITCHLAFRMKLERAHPTRWLAPTDSSNSLKCESDGVIDKIKNKNFV